MPQVSPDHIMRIASGYGVSRILLFANGLGLFTRLAQSSMTLAQVVAEYGLKERPTRDMLDLLVSVDLLDRDGDGVDARYGNTEATALFLDRDNPDYIGGILELWEQRNFRFWADIDASIRTGRSVSESRDEDDHFFEKLYSDPARLEAFMDAMNGASLGNFRKLAKVFDFAQYDHLADIGGADALLCRCVAVEHPGLKCTSFDLPAVTEIATRKIAEAGLQDRIDAVSGDFFADPLPRADVIAMGMILHDWSLERKKALLQSAFDALPDGGALVVVEALIDDARRDNTFGLFMSLTMAMELGDAFDFSFAEFQEWCREVGFRRFELISLEGPSSAAVAYK